MLTKFQNIMQKTAFDSDEYTFEDMSDYVTEFKNTFIQ